MDVVRIPKAANFASLTPGTWVKLTGPDGAVWVACGECGVRGSLEDHTIAPDGVVRPSLVCPVNCGWHVNGWLAGWLAGWTP